MLPELPAPALDVVARLFESHRSLLGDNLIGLYLTGSLVTGDFDPLASDVDLVAVLRDPVETLDLDALRTLQGTVANAFPEWAGRVEVVYVPVAVLRNEGDVVPRIAVISPGEPLHVKEAISAWRLNWWVLRRYGRPLIGPPSAELIPEIPPEQYLAEVRAHVLGWREWVAEMRERPAQGYVILTLCRALFSLRFGEQTSKLRASIWAEAEMPEWSELIREARRWREEHREVVVDADATYPQTVAFVKAVVDRVSASPE